MPRRVSSASSPLSAPWAGSAHIPRPVAGARVAPATRMMARVRWVGSLSGASTGPGVKPCAQSCRLASCARARCDRRSPVRRGWPRMGGLRVARCAGRSQRSPMVRDRLGWALGQPRLGARADPVRFPLPVACLADATHRPWRTARGALPTMVPGRVRWPRGSPALPVPRPFLRPMAGSHARRLSRSRRIGSGRSASRASTARPGVCGPCALGHAASRAARAPHAAEETGGERSTWAPGLALAGPPLALPGAPARAGVGAGAAVTPRCGPRRSYSGDRPRRTRPALGPGAEGGRVCGPRRPPEATDAPPGGSGPPGHRADTVGEDRRASSQWSATGMADGARPPVHPGPSPRRAIPAGQCGGAGEGGPGPPRDGCLNLPLLTAGGLQCVGHASPRKAVACPIICTWSIAGCRRRKPSTSMGSRFRRPLRGDLCTVRRSAWSRPPAWSPRRRCAAIPPHRPPHGGLRLPIALHEAIPRTPSSPTVPHGTGAPVPGSMTLHV